MEEATGADATATPEPMALADVVELITGVNTTAEVGLTREKLVVAVEVVAVAVAVVEAMVAGLGLVRVVTSVAIPKENTLDEVLQHPASSSP